MLLAIDTGNTQTVIGLFDGARARRPLAHRDRRVDARPTSSR